MYKAIYAEINILCIFVLSDVLFRMKYSLGKQTKNIAFNRVVISAIVLLGVDSVWAVVEGVTSSVVFYALNYIINSTYLFLLGLISYFWFEYIEQRLHLKFRYGVFSRICILLPLIILLLICLLTPWTGWAFSIDAANCYHRGPLHFSQVVVSYTYLLTSSHFVVAHIRKQNTKSTELYTLLLFLIMPALGGIFSLMFYGIPLVGPCLALAVLLVFINSLDYQISTDALTGLNNRRQFDKYLHSVFNDTHRTERLFLLLMDVNSFKAINDTYGHVEGDNALAKVAGILHNVCEAPNSFLARYGGDEFAVLMLCNRSETPYELKERINCEFEKYSKLDETRYPLSISIGIAEQTAATKTELSFISSADKLLYEEKQQYRMTHSR